MNSTKTTEEKILETAYKLFSDLGYGSVSLRQIAKESDINLSMIGYYFGGKEGLYRAVINSQMNAFIDHLTKAIRNEKNAKKKIRVFAHELMKSLTTPPSILTLITRELVTDQDKSINVTSDILTNFSKILDAFFNEKISDRPIYLSSKEAFHSIFMLIAPTYFYSISSPIVNNNILLDEKEIESFQKFLEDDIYEKGILLLKRLK